MKPLNKVSLLKMTLAFLLSVLLYPTQGFSAANFGIKYGYVPGYSSSSGGYTLSISDIPWGDLTHVAFFAALANGTTIISTGGVVDPLNNLTTLISQAHSHSVRCYLTVGGASTSNVWPSGTANCKSFADSIVSLAQSDGFDGVDMDCEFPADAGKPSEADFDTIMNELRAKCNLATPGMAKSGNFPDETSFGLIMYLSPGYDVCGYDFPTLVTDCDWFTVSGYDLNVQTSYLYQGSLVAPISEAFTTCSPINQNLNRDIEAVSAWYNSEGIPYNKMVLGMPLYGRDPTNPNPGKSDNDVFTNGAVGSAGYQTARAEIPWTDAGVTYGMDNDQSFCDKINWSVGQMSMAGIAMFDLGQGLPTNANATLTNIWAAVAGTSACITVGTNPCAPAVCTATPTPTSTPGCGTLLDNFESGLDENKQGGYWNFYNPGAPMTGNPSPWYPTVNDGLNGSLYGGRFYGLTSGTNSPSLYTGTGVAPSGTYNVPNSATGIQFTIRVDAGPGGATKTAAQIVIDLSFNSGGSTTYAYTLTVPASYVGTNTTAGSTPSKTGTEYTVAIPFSSFAYSYGTSTSFSSTALYQLAFRPGSYTTNGSLYDFTIDDVYYTCPPTPTNTPTSTVTNTPTPSPTISPTYTNTLTNTSTNTYTPTVTYTPTISPTPTNTGTSTDTPTITDTPNGPTYTLTQTPTNTYSSTYTQTPTYTGTNTYTSTPTNSPTITDTPNGPTYTFTNTPTITDTYTPTSTNTDTPTNSPTITNTPNGPTYTFTNTPTVTDTYTVTNTPTVTYTFTSTSTSTNTLSPTATPTVTNTLTATFTPTVTSTITLTWTPTTTATPTPTALNHVIYTPPYPNPSTTGPVEIDVTTPGAAKIQMDVFSTAFRKIAEHTFMAGSSGPLGTVTACQWDLRDRLGLQVADGLYYVRLTVTGSTQSTKIFKVLILR